MTTYIADVNVVVREEILVSYRYEDVIPISDSYSFRNFSYTVRVEEEPGTPIQELVLEEALALAMLAER